MTKEMLEKMKSIRPEDVDLADLKDIREVNLNLEQSPKEKMEAFVSQVGNPFLFRCGRIKVKLSNAECGPTLEQVIVNHFKSLPRCH